MNRWNAVNGLFYRAFEGSWGTVQVPRLMGFFRYRQKTAE